MISSRLKRRKARRRSRRFRRRSRRPRRRLPRPRRRRVDRFECSQHFGDDEMTSRLTLVLIAVLGLAPASANRAAKAAAADKPKTDKPDDAGSKNDARLKELQGRFKQRYEKIKAL